MQKPNVFTFTSGQDLGEQFNVHDYEYPNVGGDVGEGKHIMYNEGEVNEYVEEGGDASDCILVDSTVDLAHLFNEPGYRGTRFYWGLVKVGGVWYECDFVSEGFAYPLDLNDEQVNTIIKDCCEGEEEEEGEEDEF